MSRVPKLLLVLFLAASILHAAEPGGSAPLSAEDSATLRKIASVRERLTRVNRGTFENLHLADQNKSAGMIAELLNRAEQKIYNLLPPKFWWPEPEFDPPAKMVAYAEELLNTLASGRDPFAGKYAEPGGYVNDHALIKKDGLHHLFYIRGTVAATWQAYSTFNFGHAVSRDLVHWKTEDPVLQCPATGWDQFQVWAPHIIEHNGTYYMFYAGVNKNVCQAICLATSTDLYHWKRSEQNPVITSEPWGMWDPNKWSDCRDPVVLKDGDLFYCYYTAQRKNPETGKDESCIGISSSTDLLNWKHAGIIRLEQSHSTPPESPFVVKRDGKYYLFYTNYRCGTTYAISDDPVKGWKEVPEDKASLIRRSSASEIYQDDGKWYYSYITHLKNYFYLHGIRPLQWNADGSPSVDLSTREASVSEAFGKAIRGGIEADGQDAFRQRPITVECMARLDSKASHNILVASDTKASAEHWSLYSVADTGALALYQSGRGGVFASEANICDGQWHALAAVIEPERVRLFVDGNLVKDAPGTPLQGDPLPGKLAIGRLAEGGLGCDGAVDNVRISRGAREIGGTPTAPLTKDATTHGLWDFDENE
jgi:predicted GH43/DUF377 family glycosyl hydrolase